MEKEPEFEASLQKVLRADRLPFTQTAEEAKAKVMSRLSGENAPESRVIRMHSRPVLLKVAAAAALLIMVGAALWISSNTTIRAEGYPPTATVLPDGSEVVLRQGSQLKYNTLMWGFTRKTHLTGEGFFSVVADDRKFTVQTPEGKVEVLGTSFTVKAQEDVLDVLCKTGRVAVYFASSIPTQLGPGEGLRASPASSSLYSRTPEHIGGWVEGEYRYENVPVEEVWKDLNEVYGFEIRAEDTPELMYTGGFAEGDALADVLEIICRPLGLEFSLDTSEKTILITKNGTP